MKRCLSVLETDRVSTWSSYVYRCSISCHSLSSLFPPNVFFTFLFFSPYCFFLSWSILHQIFPSVFQYLFQPLTWFIFTSPAIFSIFLEDSSFLLASVFGCSPSISSSSLSRYISLLYPLSLIQLQFHLWKRSKWGSWQILFQSEADPPCSTLYSCQVTSSLHLYLIIPSGSTSHLKNYHWSSRCHTMALTLLRGLPQDYGFPISISYDVDVNFWSKLL